MMNRKQRKAKLRRAQQHHKSCNPILTAEQWREAQDNTKRLWLEYEAMCDRENEFDRRVRRNARNHKLGWLSLVIMIVLIAWWIL